MVANPVQYTPTMQAPPQPTASENQLKMQREIAAALMAQKTKANPFYTWANGLDDMSAKIMGGMEYRDANQKEAAMHAGVGQNVANLGNPQAAAAGGAAPASPFSTGQPPSGAAPKKYGSASEEAAAIRAGKWKPAEDEPLSAAALAGSSVPPLTAPPPSGGITMSGRQPATFAEVMGANGTNGMLGTQPPPVAPPTMLAQAAPSPQPGDWQRRLSDFYRNQGMLNQGINVQDAIKNYEGALPQYGVSPYGQITRQAPGEVPSFAGTMPGHPGQIEFNKELGAPLQTRIGPNGQPESNIIIPKVQPQAPQGNTPANAPPVAPKPAANPAPQPPKSAPSPPKTAPTPPPSTGTSPPGGPVHPMPGMLSSEPPGVAPQGAKSGSKLAMADIEPFEEVAKAATGKPSKLAQVTDDNLKLPDVDLDSPKNPEEMAARKWLDWADTNPTEPPRMPNIRDRAAKEGTWDSIANIGSEVEVHKKALENEINTQNKGFAELQKAFRDSSSQSLKLAPQLKAARRIIESPDFHTGPANKTVEWGRGLREEFGSLIKDLEVGYTKKGEKLPPWLQSAKDWALNPDNRTATANQVYTKILSGAILQSLRGMLGPNAGQFRVQELNMLQQAFGNPNLTLDANRVVMSMIDKINDRNVLIGEMADSYVVKHHKLDASFERALAKFERENPVFKADEYDRFLKLSAGGAAAPTAAPPENNVDRLRRMMREQNGR